MLIENIEINLDTNKTFEIIDITSKINEIIANSNISNGIVNIFSKHSTSAICVNENEEGLLEDLEFVLSNIISNKFSYKHDNIDNNAESHLKSFLLSSSFFNIQFLFCSTISSMYFLVINLGAFTITSPFFI